MTSDGRRTGAPARRVVVAAVVVACAVAGLLAAWGGSAWWLERPVADGAHPDRGPTLARSPADGRPRATEAAGPERGFALSGADDDEVDAAAHGGDDRAATAARVAGVEAAAARAAARLRAEVEAVLAAHERLYGAVGKLSWDEARALIARREEEARALAARLGSLGPRGAAALEAAWAGRSTRGRLLLAEGLGLQGDPDAAATLARLAAAEPSFSAREALVRALGRREEAAALDALTDLLAGQPDERLRAAAVQVLGGRPEARGALARAARDDASALVRREAIGALGRAGGPAALAAIAAIAGRPDDDVVVRQTAVHEIARSFAGAGAERALEPLLVSAVHPTSVRATAVKALRRLASPEAIALLARAASEDPSAEVRRLAEAARARSGR